MLNVIIMETQIKTTMRDMNHTFTPRKMVIIKKGVYEDVEKLSTYALLVKMLNGVAIEENSTAASQKLKI